MDIAVAVGSGILNAIWGSVKFTFIFTVAIISWVYAICSSPVKIVLTLLSWITFPFRYTTSLIWETSTGFIRWFVDEFEVRLHFMSHAYTLS
jgi:hypothetical protein